MEEIEKRNIWAREHFLPKSWWIFHWGKYQITPKGRWQKYLEVWIGENWFYRVSY